MKHHIALEESERQNLRESLLAYMDKNPIRDIPFQTTKNIRSPWFSKIALVSGIMASVLLMCTGIVLAAEKSLPTDFLYGMKVGVNEKVESFFAFSNEKKVELDMRFASRRLEEAELLNGTERGLKDKEKTILVNRFNAHVQAAELHAEKVSTKKHDTHYIDQVHSNLESSLNAHADIVTLLPLERGHTAAPEETATFITPLQVEASVKAHQ